MKTMQWAKWCHCKLEAGWTLIANRCLMESLWTSQETKAAYSTVEAHLKKKRKQSCIYISQTQHWRKSDEEVKSNHSLCVPPYCCDVICVGELGLCRSCQTWLAVPQHFATLVVCFVQSSEHNETQHDSRGVVASCRTKSCQMKTTGKS